MFQQNGSASSDNFLNFRNLILSCALLLILIATVYLQVGNHQFISFDDPYYVVENPHVSKGLTMSNVIWAMTSVDQGNWHPVTWLSHMADVQMFGMNPRWHHLTNVAIHAIASLLLLVLLFRLTGVVWQSMFVAAMFAIHPLHVESVAWVSERKDVLSAMFGFLTLIAYVEYARRKDFRFYLLALLTFAAGLMSKSMLVTLPLLMLLTDYFPINKSVVSGRESGTVRSSSRLSSLLIEKIPFFVCSLFTAAITIYSQHKAGAMSGLSAIPITIRIENAVVSYITYMLKTVWPSKLAVLYPFNCSLPLWQVIGALLVIGSITTLAIIARKRFPYIIAGWLWFIVTLLPVIGLIQVGNQSMADRYTYIPLTGLFIVAAWGIPHISEVLCLPKLIPVFLAVMLVTIAAVATWFQLGYWRDNFSLYHHTIEVTSDNHLVHNLLGTAYAIKGDFNTAITHYNESIRISPNNADAHNNLGQALASVGFLDSAVTEFRFALQIDPKNSMAHNNMGMALTSKGDLEGAIRKFREACLLDPQNSNAHNNMGAALLIKGDPDGAIMEFEMALSIAPNFSLARINLERAAATKKKLL